MEKHKSNISMTVIRRLPKYYRCLHELLEKNIEVISSNELSKHIGYTASQIRQDLNNFGGFGQQGYGYNVESLYKEISKLLGLNKNYNMIIVGAGNIGQAIVNHANFQKVGFMIKGMFDINPRLIGNKIRNTEILDVDKMEDYIQENDIQIGVICTPKEKAQEVADRLVKSNVWGIWNFTSTDLQVSDNTILENIDLNESLYVLSFLINYSQKQ